MASPPDRKTTSITLDAQEQKLFDLIIDATKALKMDNLVIRAAGGWVRDKLLGQQSHDIDFTLDTMTGEEFAKRINEYLKNQGHEVHRIGVIQCNPEQSKQLETATFNLCGISIDVSNLRSETYVDAKSRIPIAVKKKKKHIRGKDMSKKKAYPFCVVVFVCLI